MIARLVKPPLAIARAASCNGLVHLCVCLSVAKTQKRDFLKNEAIYTRGVQKVLQLGMIM